MTGPMKSWWQTDETFVIYLLRRWPGSQHQYPYWTIANSCQIHKDSGYNPTNVISWSLLLLTHGHLVHDWPGLLSQPPRLGTTSRLNGSWSWVSQRRRSWKRRWRSWSFSGPSWPIGFRCWRPSWLAVWWSPRSRISKKLWRTDLKTFDFWVNISPFNLLVMYMFPGSCCCQKKCSTSLPWFPQGFRKDSAMSLSCFTMLDLIGSEIYLKDKKGLLATLVFIKATLNHQVWWVTRKLPGKSHWEVRSR